MTLSTPTFNNNINPCRVFRQADKDVSGKLDRTEFLVAYDILYNKSTEPPLAAVDNVYLCAMRYGRYGNRYGVVMYTGHNLTFTKKHTIQ